MAIPDLDTPASNGPLTAARPSSGRLRLFLPGLLICSCVVLGATQCYAQDVAEAARQERARKESQQKKSKHVYTNEDLKRGQILTPEDRAQVEAKKNQPASPAARKPQPSFDAKSLPPNAPLGDVARQFRKQKQMQKVQQSAEFHLPFANAPALATPKPPVQPLSPPVSKPAAPRFVPYQPPVKRSPFERPNVFISAPPRTIAPHAPAARVMPAEPPAPVAPAGMTKLNVVTVQRGDSLWKLAQQNLGQGFRWHELLSVNPGIRNANHIEAGSQIYLPAAVSPVRTITKFTVRKGDSLWKIAQTQFGHGASWICIAHANPILRDANLIREGEVLILPARCTP